MEQGNAGGFILAFFSVIGGALSGAGAFLENSATLATITGFIVAVALFFASQAWRSYRFLRLFRLGRPEGARFAVIARLARIMFFNPLKIFRDRSLLKRVRIEAEFECLVERPERGIGESGADYRKRIGAWRQSRADLFGAGGERIEAAHAGVIHGRFEEIDRYFDALEVMGLAGNELRFVTKVVIQDGFVAPLHLVAGVLRRFEEDWRKIIETYEHDSGETTHNDADNETLLALRGLREIQKFIFDCWLQWGPSIPVCSGGCGHFGGAWSSLQYGYGDENNSVELVGHQDHMRRMWRTLAENMPQGALAGRARVTGHIASSRYLPSAELHHRIGAALSKSWSSDEEGRLLILMSERTNERSADAENQIATASMDAPIGDFEPRKSYAYYYSAYLWAIFVVLRQKIDPSNAKPIWVPANREGDVGRVSDSEWLDFVPFFEHGNIADRETYSFMKRQLAEKAVAGLSKFVRDSEAFRTSGSAQEYPLRFAFACSLDHSGCGAPGDFRAASPAGAHGYEAESIPDYIRAAIAADPVLKDIVLFDEYAATHPHSSCALPESILRYFDHVKHVEKALTAEALR
ncbi:MAG: hypothetical protein ABW199_09210 [Caulobacterales bacterium]